MASYSVLSLRFVSDMRMFKVSMVIL